MSIKEKVNTYPTQYEDGFTWDEVEAIAAEYPLLNKEKFNEALRGITGRVHGDNFIIYHCDIINALYCGTENRNLKIHEWD